jgi:hypothetical protein
MVPIFGDAVQVQASIKAGVEKIGIVSFHQNLPAGTI